MKNGEFGLAKTYWLYGVIVALPFNIIIEYIGLAECPNNKPAADSGFCRLVFDGDKAFIYIFVFIKDDACLSKIIRAEKSLYLMTN